MPPQNHPPAPGGTAPPARQRILDAAERLFAERGYDHTSLQEIAAAANVAPAQLPWFFATKMDLLLAVVGGGEVIAEASVYSTAQPSPDLRQAIADIWSNLCASLSQTAAISAITFQELPRHPELRQHALQASDRITDLVSRQLARAAGQGGEPLPKHKAAARLLTIAACTTPVTQRPAGIDTTALAELIADSLSGPSAQGPRRG